MSFATRLSAALLGASLLLACAGPSGRIQSRRLEPEGPYRHVVTGLEFPERVGTFRRLYVTEYDADGYDASGHYGTPTSLAITATVYHYPANATASAPTREAFASHAEQASLDVLRATPGGEFLEVVPVRYEINGIALTGLHSVFAYDVFQGYNAPVRSHLYLFALDGWYLKFRFTHPAEIDAGATEHEVALIEAMRWPRPPPPSPTASPVVAGTILEGGRPAAGVTVAVVFGESESCVDAVASATTDVGGAFRIERGQAGDVDDVEGVGGPWRTCLSSPTGKVRSFSLPWIGSPRDTSASMRCDLDSAQDVPCEVLWIAE